MENLPLMARRFRGFFPVVIDVETGGFNPKTDALLELAAVTLRFDENEHLQLDQSLHFHIEPFKGANLEPAALEFTGIDPYHPFRMAVSEKEALTSVFKAVRNEQKAAKCNRSILVGHNANFDLSFLRAATDRNAIKRNPFHIFSCFDTASLAGLAYGQTVLAKACQAAGVAFDSQKAHSALYDAQQTAKLFCKIVNSWKDLGGWQASTEDE